MLSKVLSSIKPLLFISYLTGILVFKIDNKTSAIITTNWHKLIICITILLEITGTWFYPYSELIDEMFITKTSKLSSVVLIYCDHVMCICSIVWIFFNREKLMKILTGLSEIDEKLQEFGLEINYKGHQRKLIIVFTLLLCFLLSILMFSTFNHIWHGMQTEITTTLFNTMAFINATTLISHFIILMFNIASRFDMMSKCIDKPIQELSKMHSKIIECVKTYNSIYGTPMMLVFGSWFLWTCISLSLLALVPVSDFSKISEFCISLGFTGLTLFVITFVSEKLSNAKQQTIHLLYQRMFEDSESSDKALQLIMQIRHTSIGFSCIFFDFNWKLIFKFVTACIMYLIIIIQFEESM